MSCLLFTALAILNVKIATTQKCSDITLDNIAVMAQAYSEGAVGWAPIWDIRYDFIIGEGYSFPIKRCNPGGTYACNP